MIIIIEDNERIIGIGPSLEEAMDDAPTYVEEKVNLSLSLKEQVPTWEMGISHPISYAQCSKKFAGLVVDFGGENAYKKLIISNGKFYTREEIEEDCEKPLEGINPIENEPLTLKKISRLYALRNFLELGSRIDEKKLIEFTYNTDARDFALEFIQMNRKAIQFMNKYKNIYRV